ncbi:hypothetical protein BJ138DRAFT_1141908 [Hygrophoropsis aurantiaca]|uniref:Uncharacterized protein n=1 Tax=Hygrophoropsis aurantiaca TaxID=72124 RepID=A0ACB8AP65_9AGAM|nr:hypothetical protein BJ138DRAFT_1141908 [Hygrophoropsis aurantiaca]
MSERKESTKKQNRTTTKGTDKASTSGTTTHAGRKRKADSQGQKPVPMIEGNTQGSSSRREERRSDLVPVPPHVLDQQRARHSHSHSHHASDSSHRRVSVDLHTHRRPIIPAIAPRPRSRRASMPGPQRTMLQHAWHTALTTDPLVDSDEENADSHVRLDYIRRMNVITRLRGRQPTPGPEDTSRPLQIDSQPPVLGAIHRPTFA